MHLNDDRLLKTLGPLAARLVATLYSNNRPIFHSEEAANILGGQATASKVLAQLIKHGVVVRLKPGSFRLVPFELGFEREYLGNPYIVARELVLRGNQDVNHTYYLSHGSAFDLHQMVTQPQLVVYVSAPKMIRSRTIQGTEFRFVRCKPTHLFGLTEMWVDKNEKICVSDLERTLLDGLKQPAYCGGFSEVAKGFSIKHQAINPQKLIDYVIQLDVGVVIRRLGYLMELYQIGQPAQWAFLQTKLTPTYQLLDPDLPDAGQHIVKWRLKLNIPQDELLAIRGT
jgi:predicted transcriptional regulator of viral defense system